MREFIIRRTLYTIFTLFAVATILFFIFRMLPGDPTAQVISPALHEAVQARLKAAFGLDKPLYVQYVWEIKFCPHNAGSFSHMALEKEPLARASPASHIFPAHSQRLKMTPF